MLDTRYALETPEGVQLLLATAGPVSRALAQVLDVLFRTAIYIIMNLVLGHFGVTGIGILYIGVFVIEWFYPVLFEVLRHGATPGKAIMGLKVVYADGAPVGWRGSLLRNLLRVVDFMPFAYGYGLIAMLLDRHFRRLGDHVAGTIVVYNNKPSKPHGSLEGNPEPPPSPVTLDEQRALVAFVEREARLSPERRLELANILANWVNAYGGQAFERLRCIGLWLLGRR